MTLARLCKAQLRTQTCPIPDSCPDNAGTVNRLAPRLKAMQTSAAVPADVPSCDDLGVWQLCNHNTGGQSLQLPCSGPALMHDDHCAAHPKILLTRPDADSAQAIKVGRTRVRACWVGLQAWSVVIAQSMDDMQHLSGLCRADAPGDLLHAPRQRPTRLRGHQLAPSPHQHQLVLFPHQRDQADPRQHPLVPRQRPTYTPRQVLPSTPL